MSPTEGNSYRESFLILCGPLNDYALHPKPKRRRLNKKAVEKGNNQSGRAGVFSHVPSADDAIARSVHSKESPADIGIVYILLKGFSFHIMSKGWIGLR